MAPNYGGQGAQSGYGQYGYGQTGVGSPNNSGGPSTQVYQPQQQSTTQPAGLTANERLNDARSASPAARTSAAGSAQRPPSPRAAAAEPKHERIVVQPHAPKGSELDAMWKAQTVPLYTIAKQKNGQQSPPSVLGPKLW